MRFAAVRVFCSRQATVIGPTPPGTGVIQPAVFTASLKTTSPTTLVFPCAALTGSRNGSTIYTDIDHGGARLDPVAAHHAGASDRRHEDVGAAASAASSRVREWAKVTVQLAANNS